MAVQQIGLNYGWLVNLAQMLAQERDKKGQQSQISAVPESVQAGGGPGPPLFATAQRQEWKEEEAGKAELAEAEAKRAHEIALKQMDVDSALAASLAQERTSRYSADIGLQGTKAQGVTEIAIAQKTSKEKGKELVEMLWSMDEPSRKEIISLLEKKRDEKQAMSGGTLTSGGKTVTTPGTTRRDPDDPLTILEDAGVYNPDTGLAEPSPRGTTPTTQKLASDLTKQVDNLFDQDIRIMHSLVASENWDLLESIIKDLGASGQYPEDIIEGELNRRRTIYDEAVKRNQPEDTGERNIISEIIHQIRHPEEGTEITEEMSEMYKSGAGAFEETVKPDASIDFGTSVKEFMERIFTGPFHPAYEKWKDKRTGKAVGESLPKEVGDITEQDVVTMLGKMSKEEVTEFQKAAKAEGLYTGAINGLHSNELDNAMKKYFSKHKDEFGVTGGKKKVVTKEEEEEEEE